MMDAKPPTPRSQPPQGPAAPDDLTNYQSAGMFGRMVNLLKNGWPHNIHLSTSLRVGSGSTTGAALDGHDGAIVADGTAAALLTRDRADATKFLNLRKDTTVRVNTTEGGDIWVVDPTTGLLTQAAYTTITPGTSCAQAGASATNGTRVTVPTGEVDVRFNIATSGAVAANAVIGTIATAARNSGFHFWGARRVSGGAVSWITLFSNSAGQIASDVALLNGDAVFSHDHYVLF